MEIIHPCQAKKSMIFIDAISDVLMYDSVIWEQIITHRPLLCNQWRYVMDELII